MAILISDKVYFKPKSISKDTRRCLIIIKGSSHQKNIPKANVYASYNSASKYMKQKLTKLME